MDRRRRHSSVKSKHSEVQDDLHSNFSFVSKASMVIPNVEEGVLIKVVEICSDTLIDRFLEFQPITIIIRTYEGADQPGSIVGVVSSTTSNVSGGSMPGTNSRSIVNSSTPNIQLIHYTDTDFFHVLDQDISLLLCSPVNPGARYVSELKMLFERALRVHCVSAPLMASCVRFGFTCQSNLTLFLESKRNDVTHSTVESVCAAVPRSILSDVNNNARSQGGATKEAAVNYAKTDPTSSTASSNLINEFCLMFHQASQQPFLLRSLDRIRASVRNSEIPQRVGPVLDSFLATVPPLLEVLWKSSAFPSICDGVSQVLVEIVTKILQANVGFLFKKYTSGCIQTIFSMLQSSHRGQEWSASSQTCVVLIFSLFDTVHCIRELRQRFQQSTPLDVINIARAFVGCVHTSFQSITPELPTSCHFTLSDVQQALTADTLRTVSLTGDYLIARQLTPALRIALEGLWKAFPICLDVTACMFDDAIEMLSSRRVGTEHSIMAQVLQSVVRLVSVALRCVLLLEPSELCKSLLKSAASLSSYFRRLVSWSEFCCVAPLPGTALAEAVSFLVAAVLSRQHIPNHMSFVQHEWLAKISIACGPLGSLSFVSELHFLMQHFSVYFPQWVDRKSSYHSTLKAILCEISTVCDRICQSSPSPSLLLSCWENCSSSSKAFAAVVDDPLMLGPRLLLSSVLMQSGCNADVESQASSTSSMVRLTDNDGLWDDYASLREHRRLTLLHLNAQAVTAPTAAPPETISLGPFSVVMFYVLPALESERAARRWNALSVQLFDTVEFLANMSAPQLLTTMFVECAVRISNRSRGVDEASLAAVSARYVQELFERIDVTSGWNLSASLAAVGNDLKHREQPIPDSESRQVSGISQVRSSLGVEMSSEEETVRVVARPRRGGGTNLLHRIANAYKDM